MIRSMEGQYQQWPAGSDHSREREKPGCPFGNEHLGSLLTLHSLSLETGAFQSQLLSPD